MLCRLCTGNVHQRHLLLPGGALQGCLTLLFRAGSFCCHQGTAQPALEAPTKRSRIQNSRLQMGLGSIPLQSAQLQLLHQGFGSAQGARQGCKSGVTPRRAPAGCTGAVGSAGGAPRAHGPPRTGGIPHREAQSPPFPLQPSLQTFPAQLEEGACLRAVWQFNSSGW